MSGFAGIVCADGATPETQLLQRMANHLVFRGPDATQIWTRPGAGFCFTLLRTGPSPQATVQPCSLDNRFWLLGEVRLDGRDEVRRRLEQCGEKSGPDTCNEELMLRAWRQWAERSLEFLTGDFSFALWDAQSRQLLCVRDLLGIRPFFYSATSGQIVFSNTLDVLRLAPFVSAKLDHRFIGDFLLQSACSEPERTAFHDIRRLAPGHLLHYAAGRVTVRRIAKLPIEEPLFLKRGSEYVEAFRSSLEEAVRDRLPSGPSGIFMSGGLDSTSIAATANKVQTARGLRDSLRAYTLDYNPLFDDQEGQFASVAAAHIGIPIDTWSAANCRPFSGWEQLRFHPPEPCVEPFWALKVKHYLHFTQRARVALAGDGGDNVLNGQGWPHISYFLKRGRLDRIAAGLGSHLLRHGTLPPLRAGLRARLRRWVGRAEESADFPPWIEPSFEKELQLRERWRELAKPPKPEHPLHPAGYSSLTSSFWPSVMESEDAGSTGVAMEWRSPYLDQRFVRFLLRLPPVPWCMNKELLREAMQGWLPEPVRLRPKTPLAADPLLAHAEKNDWRPALADGACERVGMFVDCKVLDATSRPASGSSLWADLRPIALDSWLKGVENRKGFEYIRKNGGQ